MNPVLASALNGTPQTDQGAAVGEADRPMLADGLSQFVRALRRVARQTPMHRSLVVPFDGGYVRICECGWASLPVSSYPQIEQASCTVWLAEIERQVRASKRLTELVAAIELLEIETRQVRHGR